DREPLFQLGGLRVQGIELDPAASSYQVASIEMTGPITQLARDADGVIEAFGLRYAPPAHASPASTPAAPEAESAEEKPPAAPAEPAAPRKPPRIAIGKITWHGVQLVVRDAMVKPPATIQLADAGVELSDLVLDLDPSAPAPPPVALRAWL